MKQYALQLMAAIAIVIGGTILLGVVGDYDYCDQVILSMSQEEYDSVKQYLTGRLDDIPSDREIAHWWVENHRE